MFCRNCGREVSEQAFACPGCGCLVGNVSQKMKKEDVEGTEKKSMVFKLFLILSVSFMALALAFSIGSIVFGDIDAYVYKSGYYSDYNVRVSWYTGSLAVPAFITGACGLGFGITSFVLGLKEKSEATKMLSIINFIFSIAIFVVSFFAFGFFV